MNVRDIGKELNEIVGILLRIAEIDEDLEKAAEKIVKKKLTYGM